MPPKQRYTKEMIVNQALALVRKKGPEAVTARELGKSLGCSPQPVFSAFSTMDELMDTVREAARAVYKSYTAAGEKKERPFKGLGEAYIKFATEEPKLFQMLFMTEVRESMSVETALKAVDDDYEKELCVIEQFYHISKEDAAELFGHMWVYSHGIATLCATGVGKFSEEHVSYLLEQVFTGLFQKYQKGDRK